MDFAQVKEVKIADISCGSGAFLLEAYQLLQDKLVDYYIQTDQRKLIRTSIDTYKLSFDMKKELLTSCIYGVDKDYNAVVACKFGLLLKLLEGENDSTLGNGNCILPVLDDNIFFGNSLLSPVDINAKDFVEVNPFDFQDKKFDYIIGNPPYMKTEDIKKVTPKEHKLYPQHYKSAHKQYDKYFLFIKRALSLLKPSGKIGYIVPNKFMKVGAGRELRKLLTEDEKLAKIISFGAHQIFSDKSTYICVIVIQNSKVPKFLYCEIENFDGWRLQEQDSLSINVRETASLNADTWVLYSDRHRELLENKISPVSRALGDILGKEAVFNGIQTSARRNF